MLTEIGFGKYGNLLRNGGDGDFVRQAAAEPSPGNKECDLCGEISNNNSTKMADKKEKNRRNDAPEIIMDNPVVEFFLSNSWLLTIANDRSVDEDLTKDSNKKTITNVSIKTSLFANNLHNTDPSHTQRKEHEKDTRSGYDEHDDRYASVRSDGIRRIPSHNIVSKQNH